MKWKQLSYYCVQSGPYTITKGEVAGEICYAAYRGKEPIGKVVGSAKIAMEYCEVHAEKSGEEEQ